MNDPLYNHPAWRMDEAGDSVDMSHVISEIVKSNYASESFDQASAKDSESDRLMLTSSLVCGAQSEANAENRTLSEEAVDQVDQSRTIDSGDDIICDMTSENNVVQRETLIRSDEAPGLGLPPSPKSKVVSDLNVQVREKADKDKDHSCEIDVKVDDSLEKVCQSREGVREKVEPAIDNLDKISSSECTTRDPDCTECRTAHRDPTRSELMMFLHAVSYKVSPV